MTGIEESVVTPIGPIDTFSTSCEGTLDREVCPGRIHKYGPLYSGAVWYGEFSCGDASMAWSSYVAWRGFV